MRAFLLFLPVFLGLACSGHAQNQPGTLKGVYGPPGSSALGASSKSSSTLSGPNVPVGGAPSVTVSGTPVQGQTLPSDVTPTPIPDRPGYGRVVVNGRRAIVDLNTNRIFQISD
jgi:Protein of unknown function (DUF1236)